MLDGALGDCTLAEENGKYNFCVKAQRRTTFINIDRVFTMQFLASYPPLHLCVCILASLLTTCSLAAGYFCIA